MSESNSSLKQFVEHLLGAASSSYVRAVLVVSGHSDWCQQQAEELVRVCDAGPIWWLGAAPPASVEPQSWERARTRLGREVGWLVINAHEGFDAEGFGALTGTVQAGGLLLLLTPPLPEWPNRPDLQTRRMAGYPYAMEDVSGHFLSRFSRCLTRTAGIALWQEGQALPPLPELPSIQQSWRDPIYASAEQQQAIEAIHQLVNNKSQRPLVLSADRGRGKSAALGIAAAQLLQQGMEHILVSAPRIAATDALFTHAAMLLPGCEAHRGRLLWQGRMIEFVAPDALLLAPRQAQLLLVDEAAAIPAAILAALLERYPRSVFSTTIHGYEGTGRGFALRFQQTLTEKAPDWQALQLSTPVRWAEGDPLERLSFSTLLLDAEPATAEMVAGAVPESCQFEKLKAQQLAESEDDLRELFGLLVLAHYRTSPNDLRQLLDGPGQSLHVLRHAGHIVAVALLAHEGGLDAELARQIMLGRRRVQGHLLPQSLANHAGLAEAAQLRISRIMRIAVHPAVQRRGLGGMLLHELQQATRATDSDLLGASFGADLPLLRFWLGHDYLPVRLGLSREASSGSHAVMVLQPLSERGEALFALARQRFAESLPELLAEPLAGLETELADALLAVTPPRQDPELGEYDWSDLESFAFGLRGYEICIAAIHKLVQQALADGTAQRILDKVQRALLEEKVLQRRPWSQLCRHHGFSGRKAAVAAIRQVIAVLYRHYCPE